MILRYSATHRKEHNKIYRLDALDAYNQKLVKKIAVRGITVKGQAGTNAYLYLRIASIFSPDKPPEARVEMEIQAGQRDQAGLRMLGKDDNLYDLRASWTSTRDLSFPILTPSTTRSVSPMAWFSGRRSHGRRERDGACAGSRFARPSRHTSRKNRALLHRGIKVLSLFFIDEVAKYRSYDDAGEQPGRIRQDL